MKKTATGLIALLALSGSLAWAEDEIGVTPYRPSVSSPAQLPTAGQLELELGYLQLKQGDWRRDSTPFQFKLAFNAEWGILLGGEALVGQKDFATNMQYGAGDVNVVLKRAFAINEQSAFGLEFSTKIPSAKTGFGTGKTDYGVNFIYSRDISVVHMDANLNFVKQGLVEDGTGSTQTGLSTSFSTPINEKWGVTAEWSGTRRSGVDATSQLLIALTYSPSKQLTIDIGLARGLNHATNDWAFFTGVVVPLGRLW